MVDPEIGYPESRFHLPTIHFHGLCLFEGVYSSREKNNEKKNGHKCGEWFEIKSQPQKDPRDWYIYLQLPEKSTKCR